VCGLCLSTTSAGVRTGALLAMGKLLPSIEVDEARKMMAICGKVPPSPLLCTSCLGNDAQAVAGCCDSFGQMPCDCCPALIGGGRTSCIKRTVPLQVISIDRTPGTTMCVIGLGSAVAKQWGTQEGARSALPVMTPCLAVAELTPQQYATAMRCVLLGFWRYCVLPLACTAGCTAVAA
jgi:hypothetical protein